MQFSELTVVIPTLNESETIGKLSSKLMELYPGAKILVVDDCSTDGTQYLVESLRKAGEDFFESVRLIERRGASVAGLTASVLDGIRACRTEYFVVMDGDLQHPPETAGELYAALMSGADLAIAARLPYREKQPLHRVLFTRFARATACAYLRRADLRLADPMSGYFGGRTATISGIIRDHPGAFELRGYKVLFDLLRTEAGRLRIKEIFYEFGVRSGGHSKLGARHAWCFLRSLRRAPDAPDRSAVMAKARIRVPWA